MTIYDLVWIFFALITGMALWQHLEVSRLARAAAARACREHQVLLLDQSVILSGIAVRKSSTSLFALERKYRFEFATVGDVRYPGELKFLSKKLVDVELQAHKV